MSFQIRSDTHRRCLTEQGPFGFDGMPVGAVAETGSTAAGNGGAPELSCIDREIGRYLTTFLGVSYDPYRESLN